MEFEFEKQLDKAIMKLNLDNETLQISRFIVKMLLEKNKLIEEREKYILIFCSVFIASKIYVSAEEEIFLKRNVNLSLEHVTQCLDPLYKERGFYESDEHSEDTQYERQRSLMVDEFLYSLKNYLKQLSVPADTLQSISTIIQHYGFLKVHYLKFTQMLGCCMKDTEESVQLKRFIWLLFLCTKQNILQENEKQNPVLYINLLLACIFLVISDQPPETLSFPARTPTQIKLHCLSIMGITDTETFDDILSQVLSQVQQIMARKIIPPFSSLSDSHCLHINIMKLNLLYEKEHKEGQIIDERTFLNMTQRNVLFKFTPIPCLNTPNSQRIMVAGKQRRQSVSNLLEQPMNMIDSAFQEIEEQPSQQAWNQTPLSLAIQVHNWQVKISRHCMNARRTTLELPSLPGIETVVEKAQLVVQKVVSLGLIKESAVQGILGFFLGTLSYSLRNRTHLLTPDTATAYLVLALMTIFKIRNDESLQLGQVISLCEADSFQVWQAIDAYQQMPNMHPKVSEHIFEVERRLLFLHCWQQQGHILAQVGKGEVLQNQEYFFMKRMLLIASIELKQMASTFSLDTQIQEMSWDLIKKFVDSKASLLQNRHFGTILVCCIYICVKFHDKSTPKLPDLSQWYLKNLHSSEVEPFRSVFQANHEPINIRTFYNDCFIFQMKSLVNPTAKSRKYSNIKQTPHTLNQETRKKSVQEFQKDQSAGFMSPSYKLHCDDEDKMIQAFEKLQSDISPMSKNGRRMIDSIDMDGINKCDKMKKRIKRDPIILHRRYKQQIFGSQSSHSPIDKEFDKDKLSYSAFKENSTMGVENNKQPLPLARSSQSMFNEQRKE